MAASRSTARAERLELPTGHSRPSPSYPTIPSQGCQDGRLRSALALARPFPGSSRSAPAHTSRPGPSGQLGAGPLGPLLPCPTSSAMASSLLSALPLFGCHSSPSPSLADRLPAMPWPRTEPLSPFLRLRRAFLTDCQSDLSGGAEGAWGAASDGLRVPEGQVRLCYTYLHYRDMSSLDCGCIALPRIMRRWHDH
jgi:hypothetical protein